MSVALTVTINHPVTQNCAGFTSICFTCWLFAASVWPQVLASLPAYLLMLLMTSLPSETSRKNRWPFSSLSQGFCRDPWTRALTLCFHHAVWNETLYRLFCCLLQSRWTKHSVLGSWMLPMWCHIQYVSTSYILLLLKVSVMLAFPKGSSGEVRHWRQDGVAFWAGKLICSVWL